MQGFKNNSGTLTPAGSWIATINESSNWLTANDPCTLLLGAGWRMPTAAEWSSAVSGGSITNYTTAYNSVLKLHCAGYWTAVTPGTTYMGSDGVYWYPTQSTVTVGSDLWLQISSVTTADTAGKYAAESLRCLK